MKGINKDSSHQESLGVSVSYSSVQIKTVWTDGSQILVKFCNFSESFFSSLRSVALTYTHDTLLVKPLNSLSCN